MAYKFMPLSEIKKLEPEMKEAKVSKRARSRSGFLTQYKRVKGNPDKLNEHWRKKRNGFIARSLAQYKVDRGKRRKLALQAWVYNPK